MVDAVRSSVPGRELGALGRGDVPAAMAAPSASVRRRAADGLFAAASPARAVRERPSPARSRSRTRELVASTIYTRRGVGPAQSTTVLVVDDEPSIRLLCRVNLELEGYT